MLPVKFESLIEKYGVCRVIDKEEKTPVGSFPVEKVKLGVCLILRNNERKLVLVQHNTPHSGLSSGHWFFVCGTNEEAESLEMTAIREAMEEIGCKIQITGVHHIGRHYITVNEAKHYIYYGAALFADIVSGTPKVTSDEIYNVDVFTYLPEDFYPAHRTYYQDLDVG